MTGQTAETFGVNSPLTRQEMAVALARYARFQGAQPGAFDLTSYSDHGSIAAWAREDVAACSALGLLTGSGGAFRPNDTTTRAMGAEVFLRLREYPFPGAGEEENGGEDLPADPDAPVEPVPPTDPDAPAEPDTPDTPVEASR